MILNWAIVRINCILTLVAVSTFQPEFSFYLIKQHNSISYLTIYLITKVSLFLKLMHQDLFEDPSI